MFAIYKRELRAYYVSPLAYIYLAFISFFSGWSFRYMLYNQTNNMGGIFRELFLFVMILIALLTSRLFAEDKRQKTDQLLLTSPISLWSLVFGKYLAALTLFFNGMCINFLFAIILCYFKAPDWISFTCNFLGTLLLGAALIAIGIFISSLTESVIVAGVCTFVVSILIYLMDTLADNIPVQWVTDTIRYISFGSHYNSFMNGMPNLTDLVFFASFIGAFLFFTIRVLDQKRWA